MISLVRHRQILPQGSPTFLAILERALGIGEWESMWDIGKGVSLRAWIVGEGTRVCTSPRYTHLDTFPWDVCAPTMACNQAIKANKMISVLNEIMDEESRGCRKQANDSDVFLPPFHFSKKNSHLTPCLYARKMMTPLRSSQQ